LWKAVQGNPFLLREYEEKLETGITHDGISGGEL
jgi:hypothetical protein